MRLDQFDNSDFDRGRPRWVEACWVVVQGMLFSTWLPGSGWRVRVLRLFGAQIGKGVVIKPRVRVKFPWKLTIGDNSWIGESVWIDNLAQITIGEHCCVSQAAYLCTGNHRWDRATFDLEAVSILIEGQCWIGAMSRIGPGVVIEQGAVVLMGSVVVDRMPAMQVCGGVPALPLKKRKSTSGAAKLAPENPSK